MDKQAGRMAAREMLKVVIGCRAGALVTVAGVMLAGCAAGSATGPPPQYLAAAPDYTPAIEPADPLEKMNRGVHAGNQQFNRSVIYPISDAYHENIPEPVRDSISNFASNLGEPAIVANDILQLRFKSAAVSTGRFLVNSTAGVAGLFDVATQSDMPKQTGDFGQTLYVWGVRDSPYVVLPLLGPTNVRDAVGNGIELAATSIPTGGILSAELANTVNSASNIGTVLTPFSSLDKVDELREVEKSSLDSYAMLKSLVEQKRQGELNAALTESAFSTATAPPPSDYWVSASIPGAGASSLSAPAPRQFLVDGPQESATRIKRPKIVIGPENAAPARAKIIIIGPVTEAQ